MTVRGDLAPSNAFSMEAQPKKPGFVLVRFYENVEPFSETKDGLTTSGYKYDEYHLELADTGDLQGDILNNYDYYMSVAKQQEPPEPQDAEELASLQADMLEILIDQEYRLILLELGVI